MHRNPRRNSLYQKTIFLPVYGVAEIFNTDAAHTIFLHRIVKMRTYRLHGYPQPVCQKGKPVVMENNPEDHHHLCPGPPRNLSKRNTRRRNPAFIDQRAFTSGCRFSLPVEICNPGVSSYLIGTYISPILQIHLSVGRSVQPFQPYRTLSLSGAERFLHQMRKMPKSMRHGYPCLGNAQQSGMHPLRQL